MLQKKFRSRVKNGRTSSIQAIANVTGIEEIAPTSCTLHKSQSCSGSGSLQLRTTATAFLWQIPIMNPEGRASFSDSSNSWYRWATGLPKELLQNEQR